MQQRISGGPESNPGHQEHMTEVRCSQLTNNRLSTHTAALEAKMVPEFNLNGTNISFRLMSTAQLEKFSMTQLSTICHKS